ncbi:MAG TPA: hypothetical protein VHE59_08665 [Mucilaginibacter sp.]|nr:hypothetical protein [Mucilaginibacter sp.]
MSLAKSALIFVLGVGVFLSTDQKRLIVVDREIYYKYDDLTVISNDPVIIVFNGTKYLMYSKELFDQNGEINQALIIGDVGYTTYSKHLILEIKDFFKVNNCSHFITAIMINNRFIKVNSTTVPIKKLDRIRHQIFYGGKDKDVLYSITYK